MTKPEINTVGDLRDALGGTNLAADALASSPQKVSNWVAANKMPAELFLLHSAALLRLGFSAPPSLWFGKNVPPADSAKAETAHV